ncbi:MAG: DNA helicase RecQ [Paludibacteraceae bacterium]|nr:DNA helicase RecQ [Paludibacteraceae bacterium]
MSNRKQTNVDLITPLKKFFGFDQFKGNQEAVIRNLLAGNDTFVLMPTGGGKSLCYQLPSLLMEGTAIVVSPLIALMKNQVDAMRNFSSTDNVAHFINSSLNKSAIEAVKRDVQTGKTKLLYVAPESLSKEENIQFLKTIKISFYAIDEAHCISEWGHDFRPEYRRIREDIIAIGQAPVIALTATATPKVQHDIIKNLELNITSVFKSSFNRPNLFYEVRPKTKNVDKDLIKFIKQNSGKSGIIYCLSRSKVEELAQTLCINGISALPYHAGMDAQLRSQNQDKFLMEEVDVIVATIAFGMGIDKPDVRFVIHYDMPKSLEGYYQETGRAGRDGEEGRCIAFYSEKDLQKLDKFMEGKPVAEKDIGKQLLRETQSYAESMLCRRKFLLHYFGEEYPEDNCGMCDNCTTPKKLVDAKEELAAILELVVLLKGKFKADHIINILVGKATQDVKNCSHEQLESFGTFPDTDPVFLDSVIHQAFMAGYLDKDIENYGLLKITDAGVKYIKKPTDFKISVHIHSDDDEDEDADDEVFLKSSGGGGATDEQLFSMLKTLRKKVASRKKVAPYVIFSDPSLEAMTSIYPITKEELKSIPGVGEGKVERDFVPEFLDLIKNYCVENEIERPEDIRVRSMPDKSKCKISIIQSIDKKISLYDIAEMNDLDFFELLDELESIVHSGTRLDINYFLNEEMDEDHIEDIYEYFREAESPDVDDAIRELGPEGYPEEEIRLVRVKFLSENAN